MKKIFILTGEPSGDRLAAKVISNLKKINPNIDYFLITVNCTIILDLIKCIRVSA